MIIRIKNYVRKMLKRWYKSRITAQVSVPVASRRLQNFFAYANLEILDVGARGGPFDQFVVLAPFSHLFICEPDVKEIKEVERSLKEEGRWKQVTALPFALSSKPGPAILHLAEKPGLSSLLEANKEEMKAFYSISGWSRIEKDISVPAETLDHAAEKFKFKDLAIIKLDTQGTELDILKSGVKTLPSVLAVYVELEFIPIYQSQSLFSDTHIFLENQGFRLIDIKRTVLRRKTSMRPTYSKRELAWVHNLYVRERNVDGTTLRPEQMVKLSCIMMAFEYFDYALWMLEQPEVRAYCAAHGFEGIEKDVKGYAEDFWIALRRHLNWFERRMMTATNITDRKIER